jgi:hypothetical protein
VVIDTTDVRSNADKQINHAVKTIGRSEDRLRVFQEIYRGKSSGKTAAQIAEKIGIEEMRVLQEALILSKAKIIGKEKVNGRLLYTKDEFISLHKEKIIRLVGNGVARDKFENQLTASVQTNKVLQQAKKPNHAAIRRAKQIKILFLAANPQDSTRLKLDKEAREIEHRIMLAQEKDHFVLLKKGAVRTSDVQLYLNQEKPTIVHFSGHGSTAKQIVLEDESGRAVEVPVEALERVFDTLKDNVRCVVLNACFSLEQAKAINKNIDFVIGMSDSIADDAAIAFSYAFYLALASGRNIQNAYDQGINEILLSGLTGEEKKLNLLCRNGIDASKAFIL